MLHTRTRPSEAGGENLTIWDTADAVCYGDDGDDGLMTGLGTPEVKTRICSGEPTLRADFERFFCRGAHDR